MNNAGCREKKKNKYTAVGNALLPDAVQRILVLMTKSTISARELKKQTLKAVYMRK